MGTFDIQNNGVGRALQTGLAIVLTGLVGWFLWARVDDVVHAEDTYLYCLHLSSLVSYVGQMVLWAFYIVEARLLFVKRRYSKLPVYLIYAFGVCVLLYFFVADYTFGYVTDMLGKEESYQLSFLASRLYGGSLLPVFLAFSLIPKLLEIVRELKEEQDLTI